MKAQPLNTIGHLSPSPPLIKGAYPPLCWLQRTTEIRLLPRGLHNTKRVFSNKRKECLDLCQLKIIIQLTSHGCVEEGSPAVTTPMKDMLLSWRRPLSQVVHTQTLYNTMHKCGATILIIEAASSPCLPLLVSISSTLVLQRKRYWIKNVLN